MLLTEMTIKLLRAETDNLLSFIKCLSNVDILYEVDSCFGLANKNKIAQLAQSLLERLLEGHYGLSEERRRGVNVVDCLLWSPKPI